MTTASASGWRTPAVVITAACLITIMVFGVRSAFGLYLEPMSAENGWGREVFAFAMALQNLLWGLGQPFAGAIADRHGTARVLVVGLIIYAVGVFMMADATTPFALHLSGGVLVGFGIAASSFSVVLAALGRLVPEEKRSWAFGIGTAAGSLGQFLVVPLGQAFLSAYGWSTALVLLGFGMVAVIALAPVLSTRGGDASNAPAQSIAEAIREAFGHRSYLYLTGGFFVCGFHVAFIAVHLPAFITDAGLSASLGAWALALVGLANIAGSYVAGVLGGRLSKKYMLCFIYLARSVVFAGIVLLPTTEFVVLAFAVLIGLLWLSTVPPTSGLVAQMFGVRYMGMLFGIVFFSHQVGSFIGIWLGGYLYDRTGSYDAIWWLSVVLGIYAAIVHWPIDERPVARPAPARSPAQ